jgi:two-component system OmpR family sensor kinase
VRNELAATAAFRTLTPFLLLLPAMGLLVWFTVGRGMRPLEAMARAVKARTPTALQPLPDRGVPFEIQPLVAALNDLLRRLDRTLGAQRQFVADAAHELRTPLTALGLQIQLAERAATAEERAAAFATVKEGLTRAAHLIDQLLTLARQEPDVTESPGGNVDLNDLARQVIAEHMLLAATKSIDLGMGRGEAVAVSGDRDGLHIMLRNLVDNAVRYTPEGGKIDVSVYAGPEGPVLEVTDSGPGIAPADRARVFDRFYRGAGQEIPGSGLGLAIVRNIAERHHARVILGEGPGARGLSAKVVFPPR